MNANSAKVERKRRISGAKNISNVRQNMLYYRGDNTKDTPFGKDERDYGKGQS